MSWALDAVRRLAVPTGPGAFRLWLALLVFAHHLSSFGLGPFAVYLFFAISGFWMHRMWQDRYRTASVPLRTYAVSRFWRLAPMMVVANLLTVPFLLAIGVSQARVLGEPVHLALSSVFLLGYAWLDYLPVGAAWSLDVEAQFYVVLPLLALFIARLPVWLWLVLTGGVSLVGALLLDAPPTLLQYLVYFGIGMAASYAHWRIPNALAWGSAGTVLAVLVVLTITPLRGILWGGAEPGPLFVWNPALNAALALVAMPYALWTVRQPDDEKDRMFGDLSYIVYLLHWAAMQWFYTQGGSVLERLPAAALCFAVVLPLSYAVWRWIDRPLQVRRAAWVRAQLPRDKPAPLR